MRQGSVHVHDCAVCGESVRYVDYCPHIFLCRVCGFPDPAPCVEADDDGRAFIAKDSDNKRSQETDTGRSGGDANE